MSVSRASAEPPVVGVLLLLTVVTGLVDATTYLGLGHVFAANMTGNVVLLGFALSGAGDISAVASIISLAAFLIGAAAGGFLVRGLEAEHRRWITTSLVIETIGVCVATALAALGMSGNAIVAVLALAMGVRNATVRRLAVPDLTTTVLTLTLTGLAAEAASGSGTASSAARRVAAVATMLLGALAGGLLLRQSLAAPLVAASVLLLLGTAAFLITGGRQARSG